MEEFREILIKKLKILSESVWEGQADRDGIDAWLENFTGEYADSDTERLNALFLLSQFIYFGSTEIRELLKSLYRDLYRYPVMEKIRRENGDTTDIAFLEARFADELATTRFLGIGNPSESGCHLLYYYRQENELSTDLFIHSHQVFQRYGDDSSLRIRRPEIKKYIVLDDFCGSGTQACEYSEELLDSLKALDSTTNVEYHVLFGTEQGMEKVRDETRFDEVRAVYELDASYRCFGKESTHYRVAPSEVDRITARDTCQHYGEKMFGFDDALGFKGGQLLIGFHHNTPDNTLPVFWFDDPMQLKWLPIFHRYPKIYGLSDE